MDMERDFRPEEERQDKRNADYSDDYAEDYGVEPQVPVAFNQDADEDQLEFYEEYGELDENDEGEKPQEASKPKEPNEVGYLQKLIGFLQTELINGRTVPMSRNKLVDTEKCLKMVEDIQGNFPLATKQAMKILDERERLLSAAAKIAKKKYDKANNKANAILDEAEKHADAIEDEAERNAEAIVAEAKEKAQRMIDDAELRVRRMIDESEIMAAADQEASALREEARAEAHETRLKAVNDAWRLFDALEKQTNGISQALRARKNEMNGKA